MKILKDIKDIVFSDGDLPISEPIVMASAAGWYVGEVCKDPECGGMIVPFDRLSEYFATPEEAANVLDSCPKGISTIFGSV
tara:strand:+ start:294 stop:536 length:243 start_codon:yes stop_codon:yes gene_type:complete